jgi:hypothetical protein
MVYQGTSLSTTQNILTMQCSWTSTTRFERRLHLHRCTTGLIFEAIKKILEGKKKGKWVEVMPQAVRSHNTTVCRATNFLPFWLMYGAEAVLPEEVKQRSLRSRRKILVGIRQAQSCGKLAKISGRDKGMESPEGQIEGFRCGQFGTLVKPSH